MGVSLLKKVATTPTVTNKDLEHDDLEEYICLGAAH